MSSFPLQSQESPASGVEALSFRFAPLSLMQLRVSQQQSVGSQAQLWSPSHSRIHLDVVKARIARLILTLRVRVVLHNSHVGNTTTFLTTSGTCHQVHSLASLRVQERRHRLHFGRHQLRVDQWLIRLVLPHSARIHCINMSTE
ncbi:hypothetical protein CF319_g4524 [Tilletia indica]|uniref:Uncharacterized protein n=1 Tax=Tilletia indica TaxID=43049 RepID=A0A177T8P4_9BASI|nr:hypothetical protein CF319_g4524 [Tilletia indica]KAE8238455.1 hypothetical protein A4X13_0g8501 [Tilletia indica]